LSVLTGVQAKDYSQIAKKDGLDSSQTALAQVIDALKSYYSNLIYMREREERMRQTYDLASGKIMTASAISLVLVILAAGAQMLYFKRFFKTKKII
jgi:predicted mannosyl-3-phosphoglycerate phosphatase (HAD superfamily)